MLKRVHVQGYKCLRDVEVELGPFNVIVGQNDSGKSSFLQALAEPSLALLRWQPTDAAVVSSGAWTEELEGSAGTFRYEAAQFNKPTFQSPAARNEARHEQLSFLSRRQAELWFGRHSEFATPDPVSLDPGQIAAHSPAAQAALDAFVASRGAGTAAQLAALALGDRERFHAIEVGLQSITNGRVKNLVVKDIGHSTYTLAFKLIDGSVVTAAHMSQGILLYLGFQALIQRDAMPGLLLVEEPERGLHPQRLLEVVRALRTLSAHGTQVVLTTHSPDLLSYCRPSEVRIFHRPEPGASTEVHLLPRDLEDTPLQEPLGQVWAARGEEGLLALRRTPLLLAAHVEPAEPTG